MDERKEVEEWRNTKYDGYQVSNLGRVRSNRYNFGKHNTYHLLKPTRNINGYLQVHIRLGSEQHTVGIHRLVAEAFVDNPNGYPQVNHIDEDKQNNRCENLEWCSQKYNNSYGTRAIRMGESFNKPIIVTFPDGHEEWFRGQTDASRTLKCQQANIHKCLSGSRAHTMGFKFRYDDSQNGQPS